MQRIHCNGCGTFEDLDAPRRKIIPVTFSTDQDTREWASTKEHKADLCPSCQEKLLRTFFGVTTRGTGETPALLRGIPEPQSKRIAQR